MAILLGLIFSPLTAHGWRLEAGEVTTVNTATTPSFTAVTFQDSFDVVPIVIALPTNQGSDPSALRIRNITLTGFEVVPVEPTGNDGPHASMTIHYVAIEPGTHVLPDGTQIAAGVHSTSTVQSKFVAASAWDTLNFGITLTATASVVTSIQTLNSESGTLPTAPSSPFLTVATRNAGLTSIQIALERSEDISGSVSAEDIGWIAFPSGDNGTFLDDLGSSISWDARTTADTIVGWNNGCTTHAFTTGSWANARIVATKSRRDGADGGWLRRCSLSGSNIGLVIDEDIANDTERNHTTESASLLSFSDSFHAEFIGLVEANKVVALTSGAYALPGNTVRYTISAQSTGALPIDNGSIVLVDRVPPNVALRVSDISGPGSGPVNFIEGSPASTLSYTFSGLSSTSDDIEFSNDGGATFMYTPMPVGAGIDANVTHIRVSPKGVFPGETASGSPSFSIEFDAIIE